jgi:murein hydrolase activator
MLRNHLTLLRMRTDGCNRCYRHPRQRLPFTLVLQSLLSILVWICAPFAMAEEQTDPVYEARKQDLIDTERKADKLREELAGSHADRRALIEELEARERNVAELALAGRELERLVKEHSRAAADLRVRQADEHRALRRELELLSELIRTAYVMGRADRLRLLLNQEDPIQASRTMAYFTYFNQDRVKRIHEVRRLAERLAGLARDAEEEAARLAELGKSQDATRQRLEAAKEQRAQALKQLESSIANRSDTLQSLRRDAESLRMLIEHLRQRAQIRAELDVHREPFAGYKGRLPWPTPAGRILAGFGSQREGLDLRLDGVLLAAREGDEVRAVSGGRVVYADWLRGFGLLLVLDHGDGFMTFYGHNQALLREVGEWVSTDDAIALSGNSGGRDGSVLYFAIRSNGRPLDPTEWCGRTNRPSHAGSPSSLNSMP